MFEINYFGRNEWAEKGDWTNNFSTYEDLVVAMNSDFYKNRITSVTCCSSTMDIRRCTDGLIRPLPKNRSIAQLWALELLDTEGVLYEGLDYSFLC